jgi:hypothetical protein
VIKKHIATPKKTNNFDVWVFEVLSTTSLDIEQFLFKLSMESNAVDAMAKLTNENPISHI